MKGDYNQAKFQSTNFISPSLAYDDHDILHIFYRKILNTYKIKDNQLWLNIEQDSILYTISDNIGSSSEIDFNFIDRNTTDDAELYMRLCCRVSRQGVPHVIWIKKTSTGEYNLMHGFKQGIATWVKVSVSNPLQFIPYNYRLDIDADGRAHVVWQEENIFQSKYRLWQSGNFTNTENVNLPTFGNTVLLAVDERRLPSIFLAYYANQKPDNIRYFFISKIIDTWKAQDSIAISSREMGGLFFDERDTYPSIFQATPSSEFFHTINRHNGRYIRSAEFNLGSQIPNTIIPFGSNTTCNVVTGNINFTLPLFSTQSGAGYSTNLSLVYNSLESYKSSISQGWFLNSEIFLFDHDVSYANSKITVRFGDGRLITFGFDETNIYHRPSDDFGNFSKLEKNNPVAGEYLLTTKFGEKYYFNSNGRLYQIEDANGNTMVFVFGINPDADPNANPVSDSPPQVLLEIRDSMYPTRKATKIKYDSRNRPIEVTDPNEITYTFKYENVQPPLDMSYGKLESVTFNGASSGMEVKWKFDYYNTSISSTDEPYPHKNLINHIYTPRNYAWQIGYQPDGRAIICTEPQVHSVTSEADILALPSSTNAETKVEYNDDVNAPEAIITNRRGYDTKVKYQYKRCLVDEIIDAKQGSTKFIYDTDEGKPKYRNLVEVEDALHNKTQYTYHNTAVPPHVKDNLKETLLPSGAKPGDSGFLPPIVSKWTQDGLNRLSEMTDANGNVTEYGYDGAGNPTSITYKAVHLDETTVKDITLISSYDSKGRNTSDKDGNGNGTTYSNFAAESGFAQEVQRDGVNGKDLFTYTKMGYLHTETYVGKGEVRHERDNLYRLTDIFRPRNANSHFEYNADGYKVKEIDENTNKTDFVIDALGRTVEVINANADHKKIHYDRNGNFRSATSFESSAIKECVLYDKLGGVVESRTIGNGWEISKISYLGNGWVDTEIRIGTPYLTTKYDYNARGLVTRETFQGVLTSDYCYDNNGNQTRVFQRENGTFQSGVAKTYNEMNWGMTVSQFNADPGSNCNGTPFGSISKNIFDANGNVTKWIDPDGKTSSSSVDPQDRLKQAINGNGDVVTNIVRDDAAGTVEVQTPDPQSNAFTGPPPLVKVSKSYYDDRGLLVKTEDALGFSTTHEHDSKGNRTRTTYPNGRIERWIYDKLDLLKTEVKDEGGLNITIHHGYNKDGFETSYTDPKGYGYTFVRDYANRITNTIYPDGSFTATTYDAHGRVETSTDRNGKIPTFHYDNLSRIDKEQHGPPFNLNISYSDYTAFGPKVIDDGTVKVTKDFDPLGRINSFQLSLYGTPFKSVSYGWTKAGMREWFKDAEGKTTTYMYNANQQLEQMLIEGKPYATMKYNTNGLQTEITFHEAQEMKKQMSYDARSLLKNVRTVKDDNSVLASYSYPLRDALGNITTQTMDHRGGVVNYRYDMLSRLEGETWLGNIPHYAGLYKYDNNGNRYLKEKNASISVCSFNNVNELTDETRTSVGDFLLLSPVSVEASSTHIPYDAFNVIDGKIEEGMTPKTAWRSETLNAQHTLKVDLGSIKSVCRVKLFFPSTVDLPKRFNVQVSEDGTQYTDILAAEVTGAYIVESDTNWWSASAREVTFTFFPRNARYAFYTLDANGGGGNNSDVAWMNEIQTYSGVKLIEAISYKYDGNGNMTDKFFGVNHDEFTHDHYNRMIAYKHYDNNVINKSFFYDFTPTNALRIRKTNVLTQEHEAYMYDGDDVCNDYKAQGNAPWQLTKTYQQELGIDSKLGFYKDNAFTLYSRDATGTNRNLLEQNGKQEGETFFSAWYEPIGKRSSDRYTGQQREYDDESGLMYYRQRMYDPAIARFIQDDPENPITDQYAFVSNNPVNGADPMGLQDEPKRYRKNKRGETYPCYCRWSDHFFFNDIVWADPCAIKYGIKRNAERQGITFEHAQVQFNDKVVNAIATNIPEAAKMGLESNPLTAPFVLVETAYTNTKLFSFGEPATFADYAAPTATILIELGGHLFVGYLSYRFGSRAIQKEMQLELTYVTAQIEARGTGLAALSESRLLQVSESELLSINGAGLDATSAPRYLRPRFRSEIIDMFPVEKGVTNRRHILGTKGNWDLLQTLVPETRAKFLKYLGYDVTNLAEAEGKFMKDMHNNPINIWVGPEGENKSLGARRIWTDLPPWFK